MSSVINAAAKRAVEGAAFATANPGASLCAAVTVGGLAVVAAPGLVMTPALAVAGFTANGVAAGSMAAAVQGPAVAAGSAFATLTSAAMGGYGAPFVAGIVQGLASTGTIVGALGVAKALYGKETKPEDQPRGQPKDQPEDRDIKE